MRKIIFLHKNKLQRELFVLDWEARFNVKVFATAVEDQALKKLQEELDTHNPLEIMFSDGTEFLDQSELPVFIYDEIENKLPLKEATQLFLTQNPKIPFINKLGENVEKNFFLLNLDSTNDLYREFFKIKISYFNNFQIAPVNFYIKIGAQKFLKIINVNEESVQDVINHYLSRGIVHFYVKREDHKKILSEIGKGLKDKFEKNNGDSNSIRKYVLESVDTIHEELMSVGLVLGHSSVVKKTVDAVLSEVQRHDQVWTYVEEKLMGPNYLANHSMATALICCALVGKIPAMNSEQIKRKLVLSSLLHDVFLEEGRLLYMSNLQIFNDNFLTSREKRELALHAKEAVELLKSIPDVPPNVDSIIGNHHSSLSNELPMLVATFIVCEDFYHLCFQNGMNEQAKYYALHVMKEFYKQGHFPVLIAALESLFLKEIEEAS